MIITHTNIINTNLFFLRPFSPNSRSAFLYSAPIWVISVFNQHGMWWGDMACTVQITHRPDTNISNGKKCLYVHCTWNGKFNKNCMIDKLNQQSSYISCVQFLLNLWFPFWFFVVSWRARRKIGSTSIRSYTSPPPHAIRSNGETNREEYILYGSAVGIRDDERSVNFDISSYIHSFFVLFSILPQNNKQHHINHWKSGVHAVQLCMYSYTSLSTWHMLFRRIMI